MLGDLGLTGQPDRESGSELGAEAVDEQLGGAVELVVLPLGIHHQALGPGPDRRDRDRRFTGRVAAVGEHPGADRRPGRAHFTDESRCESQFGRDAVTGLQIQGSDSRLRRIGDQLLACLERRWFPNPERGAGERARKRGGGRQPGGRREDRGHEDRHRAESGKARPSTNSHARHSCSQRWPTPPRPVARPPARRLRVPSASVGRQASRPRLRLAHAR